MILYVSGPMTGFPEFNFPAFFAASERLERFGYQTLNPAKHGSDQPGKTWADYLRADLLDVLACDGVAVLPGWESSKGARLEVHVAVELGLPIKSVAAWVTDSTEEEAC